MYAFHSSEICFKKNLYDIHFPQWVYDVIHSLGAGFQSILFVIYKLNLKSDHHEIFDLIKIFNLSHICVCMSV